MEKEIEFEKIVITSVEDMDFKIKKCRMMKFEKFRVEFLLRLKMLAHCSEVPVNEEWFNTVIIHLHDCIFYDECTSRIQWYEHELLGVLSYFDSFFDTFDINLDNLKNLVLELTRC